MKDSWYSIIDSHYTDSREIEIQARVNNGSPWFSGHFPGEPILPGIAQISIVCDALKDLFSLEGGVSEVRRLRFRRIIRPDEIMKIRITADARKENTYNFQISVQGELACNGAVIAASA